MNCNYCNGDEAVFWKDDMDNAFIDSHGEMLVTANGSTIRFNVARCPMCGRKFTVNKYLNLQKGDDIYYVDRENNEIEHGIIYSVYFKDCNVDSFSVDFDCGDFDEFNGKALGVHYFINKEDAEIALRNGT